MNTNHRKSTNGLSDHISILLSLATRESRRSGLAPTCHCTLALDKTTMIWKSVNDGSATLRPDPCRASWSIKVERPSAFERGPEERNAKTQIGREDPLGTSSTGGLEAPRVPTSLGGEVEGRG
ncbi:MAG: hypothetical protein FRX48_00783 [Lasallia pustulata]|uniref:Uncharacterized protein n=1 Tax=Lasallia pustulata TaxID=136370 RepID=A0A5M8Q1J5_9LECA|nr:MAG: hypothetical protein FRX48_00783 [Lasallia pustulata]